MADTSHGYALLLWAIEEVERVDNLAELARTIRDYYAEDARLPELLRTVDDRAGELLSGQTRATLSGGRFRLYRVGG